MNTDAGQNNSNNAETMHHFAIKMVLISIFKNIWTVKNKVLLKIYLAIHTQAHNRIYTHQHCKMRHTLILLPAVVGRPFLST